MKRKLTIYKTEATEMNEYELSIIIHVLLLIVISIAMIFKTMPEKRQPKILPVTLVAQIEKPKTGAVATVAKETASKKAEGNTNSVAKPKVTAPMKAEKTKSQAKPVKKATPKPTTKTVTAKKTSVVATKAKETKTQKAVTPAKVAAPVVAIRPAQTNLPSVISLPSESNAPIKPTHNLPLFEEVSDLTTGLNSPNPITEEMSGPVLASSEESMLIPDSILDDNMVFAAPSDIPSPVTGTSDSGKAGRGVFEVGSIEAFGGSNENFVAPSIITKVQPDYPDWARKKGVHGNAVYRVLIQPSGTVGDVVTLNSTIDPKLAIDGAQALRRWVFTPVLNNGVPQETWVKISVQYELN